jgi:hypothetical protein
MKVGVLVDAKRGNGCVDEIEKGRGLLVLKIRRRQLSARRMARALRPR